VEVVNARVRLLYAQAKELSARVRLPSTQVNHPNAQKEVVNAQAGELSARVVAIHHTSSKVINTIRHPPARNCT
jgi:hypothetical protein